MAHYIDSRIWDDEKFLNLDDGSRNLWLLLLTGPQRGRIPGLVRSSVMALHETLNRQFSDVERSMKVLEGEGMVIVNRRQKVICLPKAPKYTIPPNVNQLKSWWYCWTQEIPNCEQKIRHVTRLLDAVNLNNAKVRATWVATFDRVIREQVDMDSSYAKYVIPPIETKGNVFSMSEHRAKPPKTKTRGAKRGTPRLVSGRSRPASLSGGQDDIPDGW